PTRRSSDLDHQPHRDRHPAPHVPTIATRGAGTPPALVLLHFATPSTIVPSRKPQAAEGCNLRFPWGLRLSACTCLQRGRPYGLRLSACGCLMTWLRGDRRGSVLPTPQSLLRSVYAGPLYVPLIAVTAVLMPPASTGLITALVGIVYFADVFFGHTTPMTAQVGLQLLVFAAVAAVTAYFSSRVSVMGAEREALAGELRQARLEAADVLRSVPTGIVTVDQAGHLLYCNPAAEQILGFKERQWRGAPIMPEFAKIAPEFWAAITATARRGVRAMRVEATVRRPDRTFPIG